VKRHRVNVASTDIPGPEMPLYLAGARLLEVFPMIQLLGTVTLAVGGMSYAGQFNAMVVADAQGYPKGPSCRLLIDEVMPAFHKRIRHSGVFCASPAQCLGAAVDLDVLRYRVVRGSVAARSLPEGGQRIRTLRIADMTESPLGWLQLGERPAARLCWARSLALAARRRADLPSRRRGVPAVRSTRVRQDHLERSCRAPRR
jgi:WS/DGAT C-terminal domain